MGSKNNFTNCPACGGTGLISRFEQEWVTEPDKTVYESVDIGGHLKRVAKTIPGRSYLKRQTVRDSCPSCNGTGKRR